MSGTEIHQLKELLPFTNMEPPSRSPAPGSTVAPAQRDDPRCPPSVAAARHGFAPGEATLDGGTLEMGLPCYAMLCQGYAVLFGVVMV